MKALNKIKYIVQNLIRDPFTTLKKIFWLIKGLLILRKDPKNILIYSLGKAGTSAVYDSMRFKKSLQVIHLHYLKSTSMTHEKYAVFEPVRRKKAIRFLNDGGCLIINVIRDPFSRAISSVIQNYYLYHSESDFVAAVIKNAESISLDWWDSEFKKNMDWDIYNFDFDREKGYSIYDLRNNNRLLVLKQETLRSNGEKVISQFVKENIQLRRVNISEKKKVKLKFNETIKNLRFPKENINNILSSKFINHFYTDQEKLKLQKKWERT